VFDEFNVDVPKLGDKKISKSIENIWDICYNKNKKQKIKKKIE
jgi:hypothetical protein